MLKLTESAGRQVVTRHDDNGLTRETVGVYGTRAEALAVMRELNTAAREGRDAEARSAVAVAESARLVAEGVHTAEQRDALWAAQENVIGSNAWQLAQLSRGSRPGGFAA